MSDKDKKHEGPHGPDCECDETGEILAAGMALATCLAEILPALLARWSAGDEGVTVDFRFDRGTEVDGIAVRSREYEADDDWPDIKPENIRMVDPEAVLGEMTEAFESRTIITEPRKSNGKDYIH